MAKGPLFYLLSTVFFALGGVLTFAPELVLKHCAQRDAATFSTALAAALSLLLSGMMCTTGSPVAASKCVEGSLAQRSTSSMELRWVHHGGLGSID